MLKRHRNARTLGSAAVAVTVCLLGGMTACSAPPDEQAGGSWTILSYSIADTDLEPFLLEDLDEQAEVGSQPGLNLVALVDRAAGYSDDTVLGLDDWVGAQLIEIEPGGAIVLDDWGDINTGDPQVLADFISIAVEAYPADNYALIISDHGASWPGVGGDESSDHDTLTLEELDRGLAQGVSAAGIGRFGLLGFDACLMATWEVASTLAPHADRLLASQELEPGHGWDYTALDVIAENEGATPDELGTALIAGFREQARAEGTDSDITLALIDLTLMDAVDAALAEFTGVLLESGSRTAPIVGKTLAQTLGFGRSPDPAENTHMTDLGGLVAQIGVDALYASDAADALIRAIDDAVVDSVSGPATSGATGLSIYFPPRPEHFQEAYRELPTGPGWLEFLLSYYGSGHEIPESERASFLDGEAEVYFDEDGLTISGAFDIAAEGNLAESYIRYGIVDDDGSPMMIGDEPASIALDGSGLVQGRYDLTMLTISDGIDSAPAYYGLSAAQAGAVSINVPMGYYSPSDEAGESYQDALLSLTFDGDSGELLGETYYSYNASLGTYGQLSAHPEGIIAPEMPTVLEDGSETWYATSDIGLYAELGDLEYDLVPLESGTIVYIELWVVDFGGNSDLVSATVLLP